VSELDHPILKQSFAIIDREVGATGLDWAQYAIARRAIHATADFEFLQLLRFGDGAIAAGLAALRRGTPIITDASMLERAIAPTVRQTFQNPLANALEQAPDTESGRTRAAAGMERCLAQHPSGIYAIGSAPTALMELCERISASEAHPALVVGVPVGFVSVVEAKHALAQARVPQIRVEGRKGGSPVAAAILNALLGLAWEQQRAETPASGHG
jgi:precorrin-8X/cobalt-precorrin-8 methylmutase